MLPKKPIIVLDPSEGPIVSKAQKAKRLNTIEGITLGIVNNGKRNSDVFLHELVESIQATSSIANIIWIDKNNHSLPITDNQMDQLRHCHAVISGVGD